MNLKPTQIITMAAGLVLVIFSFLAFVKVDAPAGACSQIDSVDVSLLPDSVKEDYETAKSACDGDGFSAWSGDFLAPLSTWPALIGLIVGGAAAAIAFAGVKLPDDVIGFSIPQLMAGLAAAGFLIMFGFLIGGTPGGSWGIGFWFMMLGSIALLAGTVMELLGIEPGKPSGSGGPTNTGQGAPPAPF